MKIIRATKSHKIQVLEILDNFRTACSKIINPTKNFVSTSAKESGGKIFDKVIRSSEFVIFLVIEGGEYIGIATVSKIPQIRKGTYAAEIEEMYVEPKFQGKGAAQLLIDTINKWAKKEKIETIRLESSNELERAHGFYEKVGFKFYGRAYDKKVV